VEEMQPVAFLGAALPPQSTHEFSFAAQLILQTFVAVEDYVS